MASAAADGRARTVSRRARILRENLTAYAFLAPGMILLFIFGIFPVGFAFFVSLHRWRRFPGEYIGIDNYLRGLGDLAYVLFFWAAVGCLLYAVWMGVRLVRAPMRGRALTALIPGALIAGALLAGIRWLGVLLPVILNIPQRIRGQERVPGIFISELSASFAAPQAVEAAAPLVILLIAGGMAALVWARTAGRYADAGAHLLYASAGWLGAAFGVLLLTLTVGRIETVVAAARAAGEALPIWSQIILISAGVGLLALGWLVWRAALRQDAGDRRATLLAGAALVLAAGGVILITQLPTTLASADPKVLRGFGITVLYVLGTVPFQLAIGLGLAYLLFQGIRAKAFFRVAYFIPYVMPFVATSLVFTLIFGHRPLSLVNQVFSAFGLPIQKWLLEPKGVLTLLFPGFPDALGGPSLALLVIMIYSTWTYIGYNCAVFLAGLGNIPAEVYEAARIDGADGWQLFHRITLPLLSPTTFFLTLIAVIGTFQAFTQIWIMRTPAAQSSVDTIGVYIFEVVQSSDPNMGYGSALAVVLFVVILILTLVQNRIAERSVFYG
jgi:multiple sugar transport system permease protein